MRGEREPGDRIRDQDLHRRYLVRIHGERVPDGSLRTHNEEDLGYAARLPYVFFARIAHHFEKIAVNAPILRKFGVE